jgi:hypothetical protein
VTFLFDSTSPVSRMQVTEAYLQAIGLIDKRVAPLLGKVTTRVLVQAAAKRIMNDYPFLQIFTTMPYTDIIPSVIHEQFSGVTPQELAVGLDTLLTACFIGLRELTGDLIAPPLHAEVTQQLQQTD